MQTAELAAADAAFGTDLYQMLAGPDSLVLSPASIALALRLALAGARGETATEMARALHLPGPDAARDGLAPIAGLPASGDAVLRAVNTAWISSGLPICADFLDQPVTVERADFARQPEQARQAINTAVARQTEGKITDLIQPGLINAATLLVLVNALYLKSRWRHEFPASQTRTQPFYAERAVATDIDMMRLRARLAYHQGDGYQAVLLPYQGGPIAMAIVLPDGPLPELAGRLADLGGVGGLVHGLLGGACDQDSDWDVDLRLPRFKVKAQFQLGKALAALGMGRAFRPEADFSGITGSGPLMISEVVHQAFIDVDEQGTEAAAATAVAIRAAAIRLRPPARKVTLTVDRPFLFAIVETASGLPLFLGQFTGSPGPRG
jgi:serpin B